jgi:hypothetical protein
MKIVIFFNKASGISIVGHVAFFLQTLTGWRQTGIAFTNDDQEMVIK